MSDKKTSRIHNLKKRTSEISKSYDESIGPSIVKFSQDFHNIDKFSNDIDLFVVLITICYLMMSFE